VSSSRYTGGEGFAAPFFGRQVTLGQADDDRVQ